jgi:hypothetical protein
MTSHRVYCLYRLPSENRKSHFACFIPPSPIWSGFRSVFKLCGRFHKPPFVKSLLIVLQNSESTNKRTVQLLFISLLIGCYMFRLYFRHQEADTKLLTLTAIKWSTMLTAYQMYRLKFTTFKILRNVGHKFFTNNAWYLFTVVCLPGGSLLYKRLMCVIGVVSCSVAAGVMLPIWVNCYPIYINVQADNIVNKF